MVYRQTPATLASRFFDTNPARDIYRYSLPTHAKIQNPQSKIPPIRLTREAHRRLPLPLPAVYVYPCFAENRPGTRQPATQPTPGRNFRTFHD